MSVWSNNASSELIYYKTLTVYVQKSHDRRDDGTITTYYLVTCPDIKSFVTDGDTEDDAITNAHDLVQLFQDEGMLDKETNYAFAIVYESEVCYL